MFLACSLKLGRELVRQAGKNDGKKVQRLVMAVACGFLHTVMVAEDGRAVLACGCGELGQLGNGTREHQRVPTQVSGLAERES